MPSPKNIESNDAYFIDLVDTNYRPVTHDFPPIYWDATTKLHDYISYIDVHLRSEAIEHPKWFSKAEHKARRFFAGLGLDTDVEIMLIPDTGKVATLLGFTESDSMLALAPAVPRMIVVNYERIQSIFDECGTHYVEGILVHEFFHQSVGSGQVTYAQAKGPGLATSTVRGFGITRNAGRSSGAFLEEGSANFIEGLYKRCQLNHGSQILSKELYAADDRVPDHYVLPQNHSLTNAIVSGPDGYAMELLLHGLAKQKILTPQQSLSLLVSTRQPGQAEHARRHFIMALDELKVGLYGALRAIQYNKADVAAGLELVKDAIL